jgi:hypothetical protein
MDFCIFYLHLLQIDIVVSKAADKFSPQSYNFYLILAKKNYGF